MYILLDIGGTNTRIAISQTGETLDEIIKVPTSVDFDGAMNAIDAVIKEKTKGVIDSVYVGVAGPLDVARSMVINAPNLPLWNGKPLRKKLEAITGASVTLENDCVLAGVGEAQFGAGRGFPIVVYMTVSTGVGGARIVYGMPEVSRYGFEPGHQIISIDGEKFSLEQLVSGTAIEKRYGKKPEDIEDPVIWEQIATDLAVGLNNTLVYWSPDIIILGGSVMKKISLDVLKEKIKEIVFIFPELPKIEKASLDESVLWGALAMVKR